MYTYIYVHVFGIMNRNSVFSPRGSKFLCLMGGLKLGSRHTIGQATITNPGCLNVIRKTCPCNVYPLEPHFYIAKLGYAGVYLLFLFLLQNIDCGYSLEPPRRGGSNEYTQSTF